MGWAEHVQLEDRVCESLPHCFFGGDPDRVRTSLEHQPESDRLGFEPTMSFGEFSFSGLISSSIRRMIRPNC